MLQRLLLVAHCEQPLHGRRAASSDTESTQKRTSGSSSVHSGDRELLGAEALDDAWTIQRGIEADSEARFCSRPVPHAKDAFKPCLASTLALRQNLGRSRRPSILMSCCRGGQWLRRPSRDQTPATSRLPRVPCIADGTRSRGIGLSPATASVDGQLIAVRTTCRARGTGAQFSKNSILEFEPPITRHSPLPSSPSGAHRTSRRWSPCPCASPSSRAPRLS